ncbi:phosphoglycerate transport regulatory protein PgtB [Psychromonas sp. CNPT3]|uniref:ATP-binding protein n=1 Tax=Psychromonas sp. CNPT3 TaxID=314282 RepID=UPI00006E707D|nr:ATP-binding protein [Psychromonas sp. CNPT3]AGH80043.1 phosphoglycerate transport regulatory protein PgtB [Psychromonas sp. CNPT3]
MKLIKSNTIAYKLILSFASSPLLIVIISLMALSTWNNLEKHVSTILEQSVPTLNSSYELEGSNAKLQSMIIKIQNVSTKIDNNDLSIQLNTQLHMINAILTDIPDATQLNNAYKTLSKDINFLSKQLLQRIDMKRESNKIENKIRWIQDDINDELQPLREELQWQLTLANKSDHRNDNLERINQEFSAIQKLINNTHELQRQVTDLKLIQHPYQVINAFHVLNYKINEIEVANRSLLHHSSTIAYHQLFDQLSKLIRPNALYQRVLNDRLNLDLNIQKSHLSLLKQLNILHLLIKKRVHSAEKTLKNVQTDTQTLISSSSQYLIFCFALSLCISIFVSLYFVNHRIVKRLNDLSANLDAINNGRIDFPNNVRGHDEIGLLSLRLQRFCQQMHEMERTNALNLINNTPASIITCDLKGTIESVNPSAKRLFHHLDEDDAALHWQQFSYQNQDALQIQFKEGSQLHHTGEVSVVLSLFNEEQHQHINLELQRFKQGHQTKIIITITDISEHVETEKLLERHVAQKTLHLSETNQRLLYEIEEHKKTESDLKNTQTELIQAAKMSVVGQAMTSMAHELNQPLNAMSSYLFSIPLAVSQQRYDEVDNAVGKIEKLTLRMNKIINNLRHFSKKHPADIALKKTDINAVIEQTFSILNSKAKQENISLKNQIKQPLFTYADNVQLEQVLINIMVNAFDAVAKCTKKDITLSLLSTQSKLYIIAIEDSGHGFDGRIIEHLFTPFTTTKEVGLGLGLSISQSIIKRFNGSILLASNLQRGAMLILELPHYDK